MSAAPEIHWNQIYPGTPAGALYGYADEYPTELDEGRPYRYALHRTWTPDRPPAVWLMCNPSTATAFELDATIRRVRGYSHDWGAGGFLVLNMLAYRSTDPRPLRELGEAALGMWNHATIVAALGYAAVNRPNAIVCAWGAVFASNSSIAGARVKALAWEAENAGCELTCLGTTADGHPVHPLRQPRDARPSRYTPLAS